MRNSDGTFAEGNEGRPKGIPNKTTTVIWSSLISFLMRAQTSQKSSYIFSVFSK